VTSAHRLQPQNPIAPQILVPAGFGAAKTITGGMAPSPPSRCPHACAGCECAGPRRTHISCGSPSIFEAAAGLGLLLGKPKPFKSYILCGGNQVNLAETQLRS